MTSMRGWRSYGSIASFLAVLALGCSDSAHPPGSTGAAGRGGTGGRSSAGGTGGPAGKGGAGAGGAVAGSGGAAGQAATGGTVGGRGGGAPGGGASGGAAGRGGAGGTGGAGGGAAGRGGAGGGAAGRGGTGGGAGGSGGAAICGGSTSIPCPTDQVCDYYMPNRCGSGSVTGRCNVPPDGCVTAVDPVCGCNGQTYLNDCERARARVQLDHAGACGGGGGAGGTGGATACADCDPATAYCRVTVIGSGSSHLCLPFPAGCAAAPSCACLPVAACSGDCQTGSSGILILSCAGV